MAAKGERPVTSEVASEVESGVPRWTWRDRRGDVEVVFAGRGPAAGRDVEIRRLAPPGVAPAWLRQVHSADVVDADERPGGGLRGPGDALVSARAGLALAVVTADCVPVLMAADGVVAAVHAGWRGLVAGVLPAAAARFADGAAVAWIGPAIGPCCYEVSDEVADQVAAAAGVDVRRPGGGARPHLDLVAAAEAQLRRAGVAEVVRVARCTRCHPDDLWSYRRDRDAAGRNVAAIWRRAAGAPGSGEETALRG